MTGRSRLNLFTTGKTNVSNDLPLMTQDNPLKLFIRHCAGTARRLKGGWVFPAVLTLFAGCAQEMANQPRVDVMEPAKFEFETPANRTPVPGTIARGQSWEKTPVTTGRNGNQLVAKIPVPVTAELLERGRSRFDIFCKHCHGSTGSGDGLVVQRGFPAPPSYHIDRLREISDGHLFVTIKDGIGRMPRFGSRIDANDRWALVAYIRALQLSQNANSNELTPDDLQKLH